MNQSTKTTRPRDEGSPGRKIANSLVALSSAAILAVYAAGYARTRPAAERFAAAAARRKPFIPAPARAEASTVVPARTVDVGKAVVESAPADTPSPPAVEATPAAAVSPAPKKAASVTPSPTATPTPSPAPTAVPRAAPSPVPTEVVATSPAPAAQTAVLNDSPVAVDGDEPTAESAAAPATAEPVRYKDGTYNAQGWGGHGFIDVTVVVEEGRIAEITIDQCGMRYTCAWITHLPSLVIGRQSLSVDKVSGATDSTYAFVGGVYEALLKAQ